MIKYTSRDERLSSVLLTVKQMLVIEARKFHKLDQVNCKPHVRDKSSDHKVKIWLHAHVARHCMFKDDWDKMKLKELRGHKSGKSLAVGETCEATS